jgi:hypothetical protein
MKDHLLNATAWAGLVLLMPIWLTGFALYLVQDYFAQRRPDEPIKDGMR